MIDEPELNLHPKNQRLFARLIARMVNAGVKVFLTTHSDYVIRELNTVILLSGRVQAHPELLKELNYANEELIGAERVRFYRTSEELMGVDGGKRRRRMPILEEVKVTSERGIEVESFDAEIEDLNRVQDIILYTPEEVHD
jgi:ABC-type multidrug transport system ATPase subunit